MEECWVEIEEEAFSVEFRKLNDEEVEETTAVEKRKREGQKLQTKSTHTIQQYVSNRIKNKR